MRLSWEERRVLVCMRAVSGEGRRQILWQAKQVAKLERLLAGREKDYADSVLCYECGNRILEQAQECSGCNRPVVRFAGPQSDLFGLG